MIHLRVAFAFFIAHDNLQSVNVTKLRCVITSLDIQDVVASVVALLLVEDLGLLNFQHTEKYQSVFSETPKVKLNTE